MAGLTDRQLFDRFAMARDRSSEAAFEALVRRHGPMVLRVCRNVLKDWNDAEDAFPATFLVLARRCGSIRRRDSVEGWRFGVACRVAARARVEAARRRAVERRRAAAAESTLGAREGAETDLPALGLIVQEEVRRLPEKYRSALVLCYWEGLTQEQAAAQLGWPLGTVRSRLARARDRLRERLTRRGVGPIASLAASGFDVASLVPRPAAVPDSWVAATVKAVSCSAAGGGPATAGAVSVSVAVLVQDLFGRMVMTKLKTTAFYLSLIGMGAVGAILAAPQAGSDRPPSVTTREPQAEPTRASASATGTLDAQRKTRPPLPSRDGYVIEPPDLIRIDVLEALPGRPISGERLVRPDGKITLDFYGDVYVAGLTIPEVKEKIILHLRKYLSDEVLGLLERDRASGDYKRDETSQLVRKQPRESDRVFVDVTGHNSKNYYVIGDVRHSGRFPFAGNETVLDALKAAGVLLPAASLPDIRLVRPAPPGACCEQVLPVYLAAGAERVSGDHLRAF
jgi:RNA polymerase sigma factor (sigma-70 family)